MTSRALTALLALGCVTWAVLPGPRPLAAQLRTDDPRQVLEAVRARPTGDRVRARVEMTLTDARGNSRSRTLASASMDHDGATRTLMVFEAPADVRGTALLTVDYDDERDDDQWLYLPSLRRSTRIAMSNRSGAFAGSDFSYADLTVQDPDDFELRMLDANAVVGGEASWHIESVPRNAAVRDETGYEKTEMWISKRTLVPFRVKAWLGRGRFKYLAATGISRHNGVWIAHTLTARTVRAGRVESQTVLERSDLTLGDGSITPAIFTTRQLERGIPAR